jgi:transposase
MEVLLMYSGQIIFSQVISHMPFKKFHQCVRRYNGEYKIKSFSCLDQFLCMAFAQLTYRESLRDIEVCLRAQRNKLYHMGIRNIVARNTLAHANEKRDWRIYADFAQILIHMARDLYINEDFAVELNNTVYALDATTIDLCLSTFPWARFRQRKGAIKLHTLLDLRGSIPTFIHISDGKLHDVNVLDQLIPEPGSFYIMDKGYLDFKRLFLINQWSAFFVIPAKSNFKCRRIYSHPIDKSTGLKYDQTIILTGFYAHKDYPEKIRRIKYYDSEHNNLFIFLTNNFQLPALTITQLYKCRWQVELFFKWIKQHLRIKKFFGTSANAVKTQIWIAIAIYVLVAIIKKRLKIDLSLYTIMQILSLTSFEKIPILQALETGPYSIINPDNPNQLNLFD